MAITTQLNSKTYADIASNAAIESLQAVVSLELSDDELLAMSSELIEFFEAFGEVNDEPEGHGLNDA